MTNRMQKFTVRRQWNTNRCVLTQIIRIVTRDIFIDQQNNYSCLHSFLTKSHIKQKSAKKNKRLNPDASTALINQIKVHRLGNKKTNKWGGVGITKSALCNSCSHHNKKSSYWKKTNKVHFYWREMFLLILCILQNEGYCPFSGMETNCKQASQ